VFNQRIVQERKIVTAAGVSAGIDLALFLAGQIAGDTTAQAIQLLIEYDPEPPTTAAASAKPATVKRQALALTAREATHLLTTDPQVLVREAGAIAPLLWNQAVRRARRS